jgi:hypothetical protein
MIAKQRNSQPKITWGKKKKKKKKKKLFAMTVLRDKRDEEDATAHGASPFTGLDKSTVLQSARIFNALQLDARQCATVIVQLLYLLNRGEAFDASSAVELFFGTTKLFQSRDDRLRQLTYLLIKDLSGVGAAESIIVVASLTKDMNSPHSETHRPAAIRVLCRLVDSGMLAQLERHLKQSIVAATPVSEAAAAHYPKPVTPIMTSHFKHPRLGFFFFCVCALFVWEVLGEKKKKKSGFFFFFCFFFKETPFLFFFYFFSLALC